MKSNEYLRQAMQKKEMKPAEFCRFTGISEGYVSKMLKDTRNMDTYTCIQVAEILDINPMKLISLTNSEREKNEEKREFFSERVKEYGYADISILIVILSVIALTQPVVFNGFTSIFSHVNLYIMRTLL